MAFVSALVNTAVKFVMLGVILVAGCICGAKFKDNKKAKAEK